MNTNKSREWATRILAASKDKESDSYFIDKYIKPALACGGSAMFLMYYYNFSTLTGYFEFKLFIVAAVLSSLIIWKQIKKIKKVKEDTAWGTSSADFTKLGFMIIFSLLVAVFIVWCAVTTNRLFDSSNPKTMETQITAKERERKFLFWTSYKIAFSLDMPRMGLRYVIDERQFLELSTGDKVHLKIKGGAFGVPYIEDLSKE